MAGRRNKPKLFQEYVKHKWWKQEILCWIRCFWRGFWWWSSPPNYAPGVTPGSYGRRAIATPSANVLSLLRSRVVDSPGTPAVTADTADMPYKGLL